MTWWIQIALAAAMAALIELVEHWFPWQMATGKELPRPVAYTLGVLGFLIPYWGLLTWWSVQLGINPSGVEPWEVARWARIGILAVVIAAGAAVWGAYGLDGIIRRTRQAKELQELLDDKRQAD